MAILAVLMEYAVVKLISLVANVIHVRLDIPTFLHAKAKVKNSAKVKRFFNALSLKFKYWWVVRDSIVLDNACITPYIFDNIRTPCFH